MQPQTYKVIKSDPASALIEGRNVTPYYEDSNEIIVAGPRADVDHHIRKSGEFFTTHLQSIGGK